MFFIHGLIWKIPTNHTEIYSISVVKSYSIFCLLEVKLSACGKPTLAGSLVLTPLKCLNVRSVVVSVRTLSTKIPGYGRVYRAVQFYSSILKTVEPLM